MHTTLFFLRAHFENHCSRLPVLDGDRPLALDGCPAVLGDYGPIGLDHDEGGDAADAKVFLQSLEKVLGEKLKKIFVHRRLLRLWI